MFFLREKSNTDAVVINLLKSINVNFNEQEVIDELEKHPDYPNLLAISDVLKWFKVDNSAYRVSTDELSEVPCPFIAHTNKNNDFVLVNRITKDVVDLSDGKHNRYSLNLDDFKKRFKGIVLTIDKTTGVVQTDIQSLLDRISVYRVPAAIVMLSLSFIISLFYNPVFFNISWQISLLVLLKTTGVITSVLLLIQSIDKNNPLVQALCGGGGKTNCNAILTSKAATVFKGLTWSEVGFFYFSGTWLALLFSGGSIAVAQCLALLNIISLPYTIYSINYQARVAKQWCVLCTTVQALLWLEFIPFFSFLRKGMVVLTFSQLSIILISLILPVAIWVLLKPFLLKVQQLKVLRHQLRSFKYNRELFESSLKEQPKYALPEEDWSIVLGNVEANTIVTMVSNPYCPPCSKTHQELNEWLDRLDDIQLRIVFTANNDERDKKTPIVRHLMALNAIPDKAIVKRALHDWYEQTQKNYEAWAQLYPVDFNEDHYFKIDRQRAWCAIAEIKATPTLLLNGYRLPEGYRLQDIKYMLG